MAFKMLVITSTLRAGLRSDGAIVVNHKDWRDEDGGIVDATISQSDCIALGEFVSSGKIKDSRKPE
ncbi:MAG: hypothetical protein Unbinned7865contig1001_13 [Prokaryotic dsDNA virus sp.]|nr:MAG: hypothetical protein Unbinned7865contig1001_13 [Prokaryotic dsDNA virus sp.]